MKHSAENPKRLAFFHALEDRGDEEDLDFLDAPPDQASNPITDSQTVSADGAQSIQASEPTVAGALQLQTIPSSNPLKRKASSTMDHRRSNPAKRPANISEIQESLSFLIDEPETIPESQYSDMEDDEDNVLSLIRRDSTASKPVVNRLQHGVLNEISASDVNVTANRGDRPDGGVNMAFHRSENDAPTFKVPALLRRATTNLSTTSTNSSASNSGVTTPTGVEIGGGVKRGGSKKSNIHYQAREAERRKQVEEAERRRRDGVKKKVTGRGVGGSILGRLAGAGRGGFE